MNEKKYPWYFYLIMLTLVIVPFIIVGFYVYQNRNTLIEPYLQDYAMRHMSLEHMTEEAREEYRALLIQQAPGVWDGVPEPLVGRLLQPNNEFTLKMAEMVSNNAGLRSQRAFKPKKAGIYRIVIMGDSIVMGEAGKEEDRYGDQIEEFLNERDIRIDGKEVEVYSIGLSSWTAITEATYLTSRLSAYEPDLVLVLMVPNDIDSVRGATGTGANNVRFSSDERQYGSGFIFHRWPRIGFGIDVFTPLFYNFGPESIRLWERTFRAWKRLETLIEQSNGKMVFSVLGNKPAFVEMCKIYYLKSGMESPFVVSNYFDKILPHNAHPSREGHGILAAHFLHVLKALGWLSIEASDRPSLDSRLDTNTTQTYDGELLKRLETKAINRLYEDIDFGKLTKRHLYGFEGGIFKGDRKEPLSTYPYASVRSVFVLKRKDGAKTVDLEVEVPGFIELYPFSLQMFLGGVQAATLELTDVSESGRHRLQGTIPEDTLFESTVEILLRTDSYWTEIVDPTMKSFKLISIQQN